MALRKLNEQLQAKSSPGSAILRLDVPTSPHPLAEFAGMFKDDPWIPDWKEAMAEYWRKIDEGPELR